MMGLVGSHHTHRKSFADETSRSTHPIRSCRFHDHEDLAWYVAGRLKLVQKTGIAFWRLSDGKRPTGFRPWTLGRDLCRRRGNIDTHEKRIRSACQFCRHDALRVLYVLFADSLGLCTP